MSRTINVGVIGCQKSEVYFGQSAAKGHEKYNFKKVLMAESNTQAIAKQYPEAEVVSDVNAIVHDNSIDLVFISPSHIDLVPQAIQAGKAVRVSGNKTF